MEYTFTPEEILDERVCQWCAKQNCPLRNKIVDMASCKDLEFDKKKSEKHDAWNTARQKVCLIHALCSNGPHMFNDEKFREWVRQTYQGKKIHI